MISHPGKYSSTITGWSYPFKASFNKVRSCSCVLATAESLIPLLEPSQAGLTTTGNAKSIGIEPKSKLSEVKTAPFGTFTPASHTIFLATSLSNPTQRVKGSEPE